MAADSSAGVRIEGLKKLQRAFKQAGVDAQDQKALMHSLGMIVVNAANPPVKSGALAASIRAGKGKTKAVVRAGGARVPYAGVQHYGWPAHGIEPKPFLLQAIQSKETELVNKIDEGVAAILRRAELM